MLLLNGLVQGLLETVPELLAALPGIVDNLTTTLAAFLPQFISAVNLLVMGGCASSADSHTADRGGFADADRQPDKCAAYADAGDRGCGPCATERIGGRPAGDHKRSGGGNSRRSWTPSSMRSSAAFRC